MIRVRIEGRAVVTGGTAILLGAEEAPVFAAAPVVDAAKPAGDGVVGAGAEQPFGNWAVGSVAAESRGRVPRVIIAFCIQRGDQRRRELSRMDGLVVLLTEHESKRYVWQLAEVRRAEAFDAGER